MTSDDRGLPTGRSSVEGTEYDFRQPRPIGATRLDSCFTDLERDDDGLARVELDDPASGSALSLWADERYGYLMLFTGDPLPDVQPAQSGRRADDLRAERVPQRRGAGPPGTLRVVHELVGDRARGRSLIGGQRVVRGDPRRAASRPAALVLCAAASQCFA